MVLCLPLRTWAFLSPWQGLVGLRRTIGPLWTTSSWFVLEVGFGGRGYGGLRRKYKGTRLEAPSLSAKVVRPWAYAG